LGQHVLEFASLEGRVDSYQDYSGHGTAELQDHPLGDIWCPHGQPLTRFEVGPDGPGGTLGVDHQLGVGPLPPVGRIGSSGDQGDPFGDLVSYLA